MRRLGLLIGIVVSVILSSCHNKNVEDVDVSTIVVDSMVATEYPRLLTSTFTCEVEGIKANGLVRMQRDSVIWATASKFIELGRAKLTPDSIFVYVKIDNTYYANDYSEVSRLLGRQLSFTEIQNLFYNHIQTKTPIQLTIKNRPINITFNHESEPAQLTFPFNIPSSAEPIIITES